VSRSPDPAPLSLSDSLRPADGVTWREVEAGLLLLNVKTGLVCELNALGARAFLHLAKTERPLASLLDEIAAEYEVTKDVLERDLLHLVTELCAKGLLLRPPSRP